jgi:hypothetical protein
MANVEAYPDLKSNENFLALQSQLEGTENRIAIARRDYNDAVQSYNTTIRTFPAVIGAKVIYGAKPMVPFQATTPGPKKRPRSISIKPVKRLAALALLVLAIFATPAWAQTFLRSPAGWWTMPTCCRPSRLPRSTEARRAGPAIAAPAGRGHRARSSRAEIEDYGYRLGRAWAWATSSATTARSCWSRPPSARCGSRSAMAWKAS